MQTVSNRSSKAKGDGVGVKFSSYSEVTNYLLSIPVYDYSKESLERMQQLDKLLGNPSKKLDTIVFGGTNGKSTSMNFAAKLLQEEGYAVGTVSSSHFLNFNERIYFNAQPVTNKAFTSALAQVIETAQINTIAATSFELVTMGAYLHFVAQKADVILSETCAGGRFDATAFCPPVICAVTRVTEKEAYEQGDDLDNVSYHMMGAAQKGAWVISAEQSKLRLQKMKAYAEQHDVNWAMPIRKLSDLPYIYQQLFGRSASLAERVARLYVEDIKSKFSPFLRENLLATQKGQRGRPTLEAKRRAQLNPIKTLKSFWQEEFSLLRGRFELLDKEKPTVLLDNASNLDAFENVYLGIRLLHYQRPLKGLALVMCLDEMVDIEQAVKRIRYLFKKVSGHVFFVNNPDNTGGHDVNDIMACAKEFNVKADACASVAQALQAAKAVVDDRHGLVCVTGSGLMVREYWKFRGIKKI